MHIKNYAKSKEAKLTNVSKTNYLQSNEGSNMVNSKFYRSVAMMLLAGATIIPQGLALPAMAAPAETPENDSCAVKKDALNDYLWDLKYDKTNILARHGESIDNKFSSDSFDKGGEVIVVEHQKKNITNTTSNLSVTSANNARVYPGALFRADQNLMDNVPTCQDSMTEKALQQ